MSNSRSFISNSLTHNKNNYQYYKRQESETLVFYGAAEPIKDRTFIEGIKTALNTRKTRKYYALFCTGINTALRISDILKLKVSDVKSGYVHTAETKTGKRKQFPINDSLIAVLNNYIKEFNLQENDYLFFSNRKDKLKNIKSMDQSQAYRKLKEVVENLYPEIHFSTHVLKNPQFLRIAEYNFIDKKIKGGYMSATFSYRAKDHTKYGFTPIDNGLIRENNSDLSPEALILLIRCLANVNGFQMDWELFEKKFRISHKKD